MSIFFHLEKKWKISRLLWETFWIFLLPGVETCVATKLAEPRTHTLGPPSLSPTENHQALDGPTRGQGFHRLFGSSGSVLFIRCCLFCSFISSFKICFKSLMWYHLIEFIQLDSVSYNLYTVNRFGVLGCWLFWFVQSFNGYFLCTEYELQPWM